MTRRAPRRSTRNPHVGPVELVCIVLVLLAIAAFLAYVITNAGGGHNLI